MAASLELELRESVRTARVVRSCGSWPPVVPRPSHARPRNAQPIEFPHLSCALRVGPANLSTILLAILAYINRILKCEPSCDAQVCAKQRSSWQTRRAAWGSRTLYKGAPVARIAT